ncbi:protein of unknown function [Cupriavidus taiwanensis]|nr:protein of unknown function [Cupriavidus taiwanensis]
MLRRTLAKDGRLRIDKGIVACRYNALLGAAGRRRQALQEF